MVIKMVNKFFKFSDDLNLRLKVYAAQRKMTMQDVVIMALEQFLERESK